MMMRKGNGIEEDHEGDIQRFNEAISKQCTHASFNLATFFEL
jgi:hypothetical protein